MRDSGEKQPQIDDYFIPDLCRGQGLLGLLVIAGLMAVLMTLVRSGIWAFDFILLGKAALQIFWIASYRPCFYARPAASLFIARFVRSLLSTLYWYWQQRRFAPP